MAHDPTDEAHQPHEKHLQLGVDLSRDDRTFLSGEDRDAVWGEAATIEEMAAGYAALAAADLHPLELWELARLRHVVEGNA